MGPSLTEDSKDKVLILSAKRARYIKETSLITESKGKERWCLKTETPTRACSSMDFTKNAAFSHTPMEIITRDNGGKMRGMVSAIFTQHPLTLLRSKSTILMATD